MYDFAFDLRNLERELLRSDFSKTPLLASTAVRNATLHEAVTQSTLGFTPLAVTKSVVKRKPQYQLALLPQALVLRKFSRNLRLLTGVKQANRDTIITSLRALLTEGHTYRVYKLDIQQFYESLKPSLIESYLSADGGFPASSLFVYRSFCNRLIDNNIVGLPRGMAVSAPLSEYAMRHFDRVTQRNSDVYFYARYVDDIIIVTRGSEEKRLFLRKIRKTLPEGLQLNTGKCHVFDFDAAVVKAAPPVEHSVEFLGYRFNISVRVRNKDNSISRHIAVDMASAKIKRIKTRLVLSLRRFIADNNYPDLFDRFKFLTGNFNIYDYNKRLRRNVGIAWNYRHLTQNPPSGLTDLDNFVRRLLLSKTGHVGADLAGRLSDLQVRSLLTLSFERSFNGMTFYHFSAERMSHLVDPWKYA